MYKSSAARGGAASFKRWSFATSASHFPVSDLIEPNTAAATILVADETSFTMLQCDEQQVSSSNITRYCACVITLRWATGVILQHHQILRLPRSWWDETSLQCGEQQVSSSNITKYCACHDPGHRWNVIYTAVSNRCHPPTSPNTVLATILVTDETSLHCGEQQVSSSNITKYCACHDPGHGWNVITLRWATGVILQHHQILCLPRSWSQMKRHLQCGEQQVSSSNITKYCACHDPGRRWNVITLRWATGVILQHHQILCLPRSWSRMKRHYTAVSNRCHPPTSPNTAPATKKTCHDRSFCVRPS